MRFSLHQSAAVLVSASLVLICSCEKHHVGELPEHESAQGTEAHDGSTSPIPGEATQDYKAHGDSGASTSPAAATPTPAEFFPKSSPR